MPFYDEAGEPLDRIFLVQRSPRYFQLVRPISFLESGRPEAERVLIPAHNIQAPAIGDNKTDLASVPTFLWGLIASYGRQTGAALLHDHLSADARHGEPATRIRRRRAADRLFRVALMDSGIAVLRAAIMWAFVSVGKFVEFRRWQGCLMIGHAVLAAAFLYAVFGAALGVLRLPAAFEPWLLVLLLVPMVSVIPWWRDAVAMVVIVYAGTVLAPFMACAALAQLVLLLMEGAVWLVSGRRGPAPMIGPTILARRRVP